MTREHLQVQLLHLCSRTGLTTLLVTTTIEEAIVLAGRNVMIAPGL